MKLGECRRAAPSSAYFISNNKKGQTVQCARARIDILNTLIKQ